MATQDTPSRLQIARLKIRTMLGIEELEIEPGRVTLIEGRNGVGKSSVLAAVKAVVAGGHDASLIRVGADAAEAVIVLDDETELRRRITPSGSRLEVDHDGAVRRAPQTWLSRMTDSLGLNPIAFLEAAPRDQARMILEAMPVQVTAGELRDAIGPDTTTAYTATESNVTDDEPVEGHGLEVIDYYRKSLYDQRTGVNRLAREHQATATQLEAAVPEDLEPVEDLDEQLANLDAECDEYEQQRYRRHEELLSAHETAVDEVARVADVQVAALQEQIAALRAQMHEVQQQRDAKISECGRTLAERKAEIDRDIDAGLASAKKARAELQGEVRRVEDARRTVEAAELQREKLRAAKRESLELTNALDRLDALKATLLERLPIRGITVRDGVLYRGDIPFQRLNRAEQIKVALRLAMIRTGDIPIVCADGLEALDPEAFEAFVSEVRQQDVYLFATRVTSDPELVIRTDRAEVASA